MDWLTVSVGAPCSGREDKKKSNSVQTTAAPSANAVVTSRPSVDTGGAVGENNKLEGDIHQQLYKYAP